jgi:hypothetical protein
MGISAVKKLFLIIATFLAFIAPPLEAKRVLITKGYSGAAYTFNITSSNTSQVRTAKAADNRNVRLAFLGDSTMRGVDETAIPYNSQYPNAMPMKLAAVLNSNGIVAGANNWYGISGNTLVDYTNRDSRVAATGATAAFAVAVPVQGGAEIEFPTAAGTWSFTSQFPVSQCDIYYQDSTAGRSFSWTVDSGLTGNITTVGANAILKQNISLGNLNNHKVTFSWIAGFVRIYGIDCYDASRFEISLWQYGISGGTASDMVNDTGAPSSGRLQQLKNFVPDLIVCECGLVNSWRNSQSLASTKANLTTLVQTAKTAGSNFIFLTPPYDDSSAGASANQAAYVNLMYQVAAEQNVGLIDLRQRWVSYSYSVSRGWMVSTDAVHPTLAGYQDEAANVMFDVIKSILDDTFAN